MPRPLSHQLRVVHERNRQKPWVVRWRATVKGRRATCRRCFETEKEAHAFKARCVLSSASSSRAATTTATADVPPDWRGIADQCQRHHITFRDAVVRLDRAWPKTTTKETTNNG